MTTQISTQDAYNFLRNYNGGNNFVQSVKSYFLAKGVISEKQLGAVINFFERENAPKQIPTQPVPQKSTLKNPIFIKIKGIYFVKSLCEKLNIGNIKSYAWVVKEVVRETEKAVLVRAEIPNNSYTLDFCRNCGRRLTDKFSIATGMGKVCADNYGIDYIKDLSEVENFKVQLDNVIKQVGVKEFWLPKRRIEEVFLNKLLDEIQNSK